MAVFEFTKEMPWGNKHPKGNRIEADWAQNKFLPLCLGATIYRGMVEGITQKGEKRSRQANRPRRECWMGQACSILSKCYSYHLSLGTHLQEMNDMSNYFLNVSCNLSAVRTGKRVRHVGGGDAISTCNFAGWALSNQLSVIGQDRGGRKRRKIGRNVRTGKTRQNDNLIDML